MVILETIFISQNLMHKAFLFILFSSWMIIICWHFYALLLLFNLNSSWGWLYYHLGWVSFVLFLYAFQLHCNSFHWTIKYLSQRLRCVFKTIVISIMKILFLGMSWSIEKIVVLVREKIIVMVTMTSTTT